MTMVTLQMLTLKLAVQIYDNLIYQIVDQGFKRWHDQSFAYTRALSLKSRSCYVDLRVSVDGRICRPSVQPRLYETTKQLTSLVPSMGWSKIFGTCCSPVRLWNIWNSKCLQRWRISNCRTAEVLPFGNWTQFEKGMPSSLSIPSRKSESVMKNMWTDDRRCQTWQETMQDAGRVFVLHPWTLLVNVTSSPG